MVAIAAAALAGGLVASSLWPPRPLLLWNRTPSSPIGLYRVTAADAAGPGDTVVAWPPASARALAAQRRYLPANVPLVKSVAASAGDRVCAAGEAVFVNGRLEALRSGQDAAGRPLPWWTGCVQLRQGDLFLLLPEAAGSFDGRYFGVTERQDVVGEARLIWPR